MEFRENLEKYLPFNEQEEKDKAYFLKFIDSFEDTLTRDNVFGHFSSSAFVLNRDRTKILLVYHNIYQGYIFPGGHVDGEKDFLSVAKREVEEETGVKADVLTDKIFSIWTGPVKAHIKRGKFVPAHTHLDVVYLMEADENIKLKIKPDENQSVVWAKFEEIGKNVKLVDFFVPEYEKFIKKLNLC